MEYRQWQRYREEMKVREIAERQNDITAPRPALQASINDQAIRDLLDRVAKLEASATLKVFSSGNTFDPIKK